MTVVTAVGSVPDFFEYYEELMKPHPPMRLGQQAFLLLSKYRPDLVERVLCSEFDPFYVDDRLPAFFDWLMDNWETLQ